MSRRSANRQTLTMSLFPFLAVLICTMGALIVLLVVLVLQARVNANPVEPEVEIEVQEVVKSPPVDPIKLQTDNRQNEEALNQLLQQREQAKKQLEDQRLQLSGIEDHTRELIDNLRLLQQQIETLENQQAQQNESDEQLNQQIDLLEKQFQEGEQRLAELKEEASKKKPAYALIPFDGVNGTNRRPIYIECKSDRVIIQPEGIELHGADFREPLGPGNPLDSALRAIREYRHSQAVGNSNPYPLLIIRPGGAESYSAARDAMRSWDAEFGYELIDNEIELDYPPSDPFLAKRLVETVEIARRRKVALMMAAPGKFGRAEDSGMLAGSGSNFFPSASSGSGSSENPFETNRFETNRFVEGGHPSPENSLPGSKALQEFQSQQNQSIHQDANLSSSQGQIPKFNQQNQPWQQQGSSSQFPELNSPEKNNLSESALEANSNTNNFQPIAQGSFYSADKNPSDKIPYQPNSRYSSGTANSSQVSSQNASASGSGSGNSQQVQPVASTKGRDWALPNKGARAIAYTRPIRLECHHNRLVLIPERGSGKPLETVPFQQSTKEAVSSMVNKIWSRIDSWGSAGRGGYWRPLLNVEVTPGAEQQFAELQILMQGSGIDIKRIK